MNKRLGLAAIGMGFLLALGGCGNQTFLDTTYTFNYAQFTLPDGTVIEGRLQKWKDYDGEQIQLVMEDGNTYLVSSFNATLTVNPIEEAK